MAIGGAYAGHIVISDREKPEAKDAVAALKDAGIYDDTIIVMTGDHGGKNKGHGGFTLQELESPFIVFGKNVKKGYEITDPMMQYDVTSTIAYIFGLKIPASWVGRPMKQIFR
jgi:arylsulfatase A-like enzyme